MFKKEKLKKLPYFVQSSIKALIALMVIGLIFFYWSQRPVNNEQRETTYIVKSGDTFNKVLKDLRKVNYIRSYYTAKIIQVMTGSSLKKGEYKISPHMSVWEIVKILDEGKLPLFKIVIPEGFISTQIKDRLLANGFINAAENFMKEMSNQEIIKKYDIKANNLEGYLFPSTYYIHKDINAKTLIDIMVKTFFLTLNEISSNINVDALHQQITLASIIEKEAVVLKDRPLIASVFLNRLSKDMKLESCATVIYLFKTRGISKKRIYYKDLKVESPYNTYINKGLPPGPISNPGKESINAAINPASSSYLFFVYKGNGEHIFTTNYKDHMNAYRKYIQFQYIDKSADA